MSYTRAVFKPQDLLGIIVTIQDLFANCPAETNHFSEFAHFGIFEVHLPVENEIDVCFGRLILFVNALIGLHSKKDAVFKEVFECIYGQKMENGVLQSDPAHHQLASPVVGAHQPLEFGDVLPHFGVQIP